MNNRSAVVMTLVSLGLLLVVGAIYLQTGSHAFIDFDDNEYV
jgi:hypothetical protein